MKSIAGAIVGAAAVGAVLVAYNLGARQAVTAAAAPTVQMFVGPDGVARPYLVQTGQTAGPPMVGQPSYGVPVYGTIMPGAVAPNNYAAYSAYPAYQPAGAQPVQTRYVTERTVAQPAARRAARPVSSEVIPRRSWQKSALLIGGSAGAGAGLGGLMGGKKGALAGAAIGGGAAAIYDQVKRH
jgi:hypothetical protein